MVRRLVIGAGRLGSAVISTWLDAGHDVTAIDVAAHRLERLESSVDRVLGSGDDRSVVAMALDRCDVVAIFTNGPFPAQQSNEQEWARALEATSRTVRDELRHRDRPVDVIVGSTITVYGSASGPVVDERTTPVPSDAVGRFVRRSEMVWEEVENPAISTLAMLRFGHVYGQRNEPDHPMTMARFMSGRTLSYRSDSTACMVCLDDATASVEHALSTKLRGPVNVVDDETTTRSALYDPWCDAAGIPRPSWAAASGELRTYSSARLRDSGFVFRGPQQGHGPMAPHSAGGPDIASTGVPS